MSFQRKDYVEFYRAPGTVWSVKTVEEMGDAEQRLRLRFVGASSCEAILRFVDEVGPFRREVTVYDIAIHDANQMLVIAFAAEGQT